MIVIEFMPKESCMENSYFYNYSPLNCIHNKFYAALCTRKIGKAEDDYNVNVSAYLSYTNDKKALRRFMEHNRNWSVSHISNLVQWKQRLVLIA